MLPAILIIFCKQKLFFLPLKIDNWGWEKQTNEKTHVFCEDWSTWNSTIWTMSKFVFSANLPFEALKKGKKRPKTSFENFCFEGWNPWNLTRNGVKKKKQLHVNFLFFPDKSFFLHSSFGFCWERQTSEKTYFVFMFLLHVERCYLVRLVSARDTTGLSFGWEGRGT